MQVAAPQGPTEAERAARAPGAGVRHEDLLLLVALPIAAAVVGVFGPDTRKLRLEEINASDDAEVAHQPRS